MPPEIRVTLPDGSEKRVPAGSTGVDLAKAIGPGLAKAALAVRVNGTVWDLARPLPDGVHADRKSTRLNSSHLGISYAVFCLKKKKTTEHGDGAELSGARVLHPVRSAADDDARDVPAKAAEDLEHLAAGENGQAGSEDEDVRT